MNTKNCLNCGTEFEAKLDRARFCKPACRAAFARKEPISDAPDTRHLAEEPEETAKSYEVPGVDPFWWGPRKLTTADKQTWIGLCLAPDKWQGTDPQGNVRNFTSYAELVKHVAAIGKETLAHQFTQHVESEADRNHSGNFLRGLKPAKSSSSPPVGG